VSNLFEDVVSNLRKALQEKGFLHGWWGYLPHQPLSGNGDIPVSASKSPYLRSFLRVEIFSTQFSG
jgi:hypothetical protein